MGRKGSPAGQPTLFIGLANILAVADDEKRCPRVVLLVTAKPNARDSGTSKPPEWTVGPPEKLPESLPVASEFLKLCRSCNQDLQGKDVYMYRGEMAFCSSACREGEMAEEKTEASF